MSFHQAYCRNPDLTLLECAAVLEAIAAAQAAGFPAEVDRRALTRAAVKLGACREPARRRKKNAGWSASDLPPGRLPPGEG